MQTDAGINCDIIKYSAGDRPPTTRDFKGSFLDLSRGFIASRPGSGIIRST